MAELLKEHYKSSPPSLTHSLANQGAENSIALQSFANPDPQSRAQRFIILDTHPQDNTSPDKRREVEEFYRDPKSGVIPIVNQALSAYPDQARNVMSESKNPRAATSVEVYLGYGLEDLAIYRDSMETYWEDARERALHILKAEDVASEFELAIEKELGGKTARRHILHPEVVDLFEHKERIDDFLWLWHFGYIKKVDIGYVSEYYLTANEQEKNRIKLTNTVSADIQTLYGHDLTGNSVNEIEFQRNCYLLYYALRNFVLYGINLENTNRHIEAIDYDDWRNLYKKEPVISNGVELRDIAQKRHQQFLKWVENKDPLIHDLGIVIAMRWKVLYSERSDYGTLDSGGDINRNYAATSADKHAFIQTEGQKNNTSKVNPLLFTARLLSSSSANSTVKLRIDFPSSLYQQNNELGDVVFLVTAPDFYIEDEQNKIVSPVSASIKFIDLELRPRISGSCEIKIEPYVEKIPCPPIVLNVVTNQRNTKDVNKLPNPVKPRTVPQPDICLRTYVIPTNDSGEEIKIEYILYSPIYSLHFPSSTPAGSVTIKLADIKRILARLNKTVSVEDIGWKHQSLSVIGRELYELLIPPILRKYYIDIYKSKVKNILFLSDPTLWIPWELIKPHAEKWEHDYLGKRFNIGKWIEGWGVLRQDEFPIGQVCLAGISEYSKHYSLAEWQDLLSAGDIPHLRENLFVELDGGISIAMDYQTPFWGVHLEDIPDALVEKTTDMVRLEDKPLSPENIRSYALNLHAKRPLVTFGMRTQKNTSAFTRMEETWLPTFIQSGASAFVGAMWAVQPEIDQLFWRSFYQSIWSGSALGEAVNLARRNVSDAYPETIDGLSYYLIGDPMSVGYVPPLGEAFVTLECLDHDVRQPMAVGKKYTFQASIRSAPPIWYKDRLHQSTDSKWDEPKLQVIGNSCDVTPSKLMTFTEVSPRHLTCRFELTPKERKRTEVEAGDDDIFFNFLFGADREIIKSISLPVIIKSKEVGDE